MNKLILALITYCLTGLSVVATVSTKTDGKVVDSWTSLPEKTIPLGAGVYELVGNATGITRKYQIPGTWTGHLVATVRKRTDKNGSRYGLEIIGYTSFKMDDETLLNRINDSLVRPPPPDEAAGIINVRLLVAEADLKSIQDELNKIRLLIGSPRIGSDYESEISRNRLRLYRYPEGIFFNAAYQGEVSFVGPDVSWLYKGAGHSIGAYDILGHLCPYFENAVALFDSAKRELDGF